MIAILKFNQQDNSDRINKHPKHQIITVNNNQFGALHFINAPYKSSDRTDKFFGAVSFGFLTRELPSSVEPGDEDDEIFPKTVSSFLLP
jgi:hypothetical protein